MKRQNKITLLYIGFVVLMCLGIAVAQAEDASLSTQIAAAINVNKRTPLSVRAAALYSKNEMPALYKAAIAGDVAKIKQLAKQGVNLNEQLPTNGDTPMHGAAMRNQSGAVKALVAAGAQKDIKDDEGKTPLELARELNRKDIIPLLQ